MVFYLHNDEEIDRLTRIIEDNGGLVTDLHECFTYQICKPTDEGDLMSHLFFAGNVYSADWLTNSVKAGKLLDK